MNIISDTGHMRGVWDEKARELTIKEGKRVTRYLFYLDGRIEAKDEWKDKK